MKSVFALIPLFATLIYAADQPAQPVKPTAGAAAQTQPATNPPALADSQVVKKMGKVSWDPDAHKLTWTVETGSLVNGEFVKGSEAQYEISPDQATMKTAEETRGFDGDEAEGLHQLLDVLSLYCAESVAWWDAGLGEPVQSQPSKTESTDPQKPVRVQQPNTKPALPPIPGTKVAELRVNP